MLGCLGAGESKPPWAQQQRLAALPGTAAVGGGENEGWRGRDLYEPLISIRILGPEKSAKEGVIGRAAKIMNQLGWGVSQVPRGAVFPLS